jgi:hypothetical protein
VIEEVNIVFDVRSLKDACVINVHMDTRELLEKTMEEQYIDIEILKNRIIALKSNLYPRPLFVEPLAIDT